MNWAHRTFLTMEPIFLVHSRKFHIFAPYSHTESENRLTFGLTNHDEAHTWRTIYNTEITLNRSRSATACVTCWKSNYKLLIAVYRATPVAHLPPQLRRLCWNVRSDRTGLFTYTAIGTSCVVNVLAIGWGRGRLHAEPLEKCWGKLHPVFDLRSF
jgi:hypothetical protein